MLPQEFVSVVQKLRTVKDPAPYRFPCGCVVRLLKQVGETPPPAMLDACAKHSA